MIVIDKRTENQKAEAGDLIKMGLCLCLVVNKNEWENKYCKGDLAVVLINFESGDDLMELSNDCQKYFENGEYEIYAKKGTWGIFVE